MSALFSPPIRPSVYNIHGSSRPFVTVDVVHGDDGAEPDTAAAARALHSRRALERALHHGTALLAALDLAPVECRTRRERKARRKALAPVAALDAAVRALDALDGDADAEPDLGAPENHPGSFHIDMDHRYHVGRGRRPLGSQREWGVGLDAESDGTDGEPEAGYDLPCDQDELDGSEHDGREPDVCAEHATAPERHGCGFILSGPEDAEDSADLEPEPDDIDPGEPRWWERPAHPPIGVGAHV